MTIIAGIVAEKCARPNPNASHKMLSFIEAPQHTLTFHHNNTEIDIGARHRKNEGAFHADSDCVVVGDVRLGNRSQLAKELGLDLKSLTDGRLLASAFQKWREGMAPHLEGDFAIAIWSKTERSLTCLRDRFGRMPLCYMQTSTGIRFASDFLALAMSAEVPPEINQNWVVSYIEGMVESNCSTPFRGVFSLPPASVLKWKNGNLSLNRYWSFAEVDPTSENVSIDELREALTTSLSKRTEQSTFAALLSGGLDSSSVSILARDHIKRRNGEALKTLSLVFDETPEESERRYIEAVLDTGGFEAKFVNVDSFDLVGSIERIVRVQGAPTLAAGQPVFENVLRAAANSGARTILDGHGGDETVSLYGFSRLLELADDGKFVSLFREILPLSRQFRPSAIEYFTGIYGSRRTGISGRISRRINQRFRKSSGSEKSKSIDSLLAPHWIDQEHSARKKKHFEQSKVQYYADGRDFQRMLLESPLQSRGFEVLTRQYRSHGLRVEFPFWDQKVVELCLMAPSSQKYGRGVTRNLLRSVMADRLPQLVESRTDKLDFTGHLARGLRQDSEKLRDLIGGDENAVSNYVDQKQYHDALSRVQQVDAKPLTQDAVNLWRAASLAIWLEYVSKMLSMTKPTLEVPC